jgi:hypothetical protein
VHVRRKLTVDKVFGKWQDSFDVFFRWKAEVERICPSSVVVIEYHQINEKTFCCF